MNSLKLSLHCDFNMILTDQNGDFLHHFFWNPMGSGLSNLDETSQVGAEAFRAEHRAIGEGFDR